MTKLFPHTGAKKKAKYLTKMISMGTIKLLEISMGTTGILVVNSILKLVNLSN